MRRPAIAFVLIGLAAVPLGAQGPGDRDLDRAQGIPHGQLTPGECRVWYDGRPPGHQPPPTNCREAERIASRDRSARVIYGGEGREDDRRVQDRPSAIPRPVPTPYPYPDRYRYPERRYPDGSPNARSGYGYLSVPFDNGYEDGYDKGRGDARGHHAYDPVRHGRYRSGDHGYDRRYSSKDEYRNVYRDGFRAGYDDGYRDVYGPDRRRSSIRLPWPL